ncbi:MAG: aminotransferase class V-fold PLP-dependent enzyme, partial [Actinomycetia bacterium]|nr:aminotransferase class V-fold PLP-dependent enzyme [Actinomycetes bacterium]
MALVTPPEPAAAMTVLLSTPVVAGREHELVSATLDSGWLAPAGPQLDQFEADLAAWVDDQAVVALSSGSAGLHLALAVAGVQPGDEVVVQTATFAASAFAVHHAGAIPVFCDIDEVTANLDPDLLAEKLTERARRGRLPAAVVSVDLYGYCADYQRLKQVCQEFGVPLIQDAAESLGSRAAGQAAGAHGELGVLSFNGNKIITTSGGGALTGPRELVERARKLSTQAREPGLHYEHQEIGYNYRLSGLLASVGTAQLETLEDRITRKTALHDRYVEALPRLDW